MSWWSVTPVAYMNGCGLRIQSRPSVWPTLVSASLLSTAMFGCAVRTDQRDHGQQDTAQLEVASVYAAVISAEMRPQPGAPILVAPLTHPPLYDDCRPTAVPASDVWRSAIDNYIAVRHVETSIPSTLPLPQSRYKLLPRGTESTRGCDTQKPFSFIQMSRVGFDTTRTFAVVHRVHACSCMVCGDGSDVFLQKQNGEWHIVQPPGLKGCGWIS